jgi:hypothetical protein
MNDTTGEAATVGLRINQQSRSSPLFQMFRRASGIRDKTPSLKGIQANKPAITRCFFWLNP